MTPFVKCPVCGGELVKKPVEKPLRGGDSTASIMVEADVCLRWGERLYAQETIRRFAQVRRRLERHETADFQLVGQPFRVN